MRKGKPHVQSTRADAIQQHGRGTQSPRGRVEHRSGPGLRADEDRQRGDSGGGREWLQFRDARRTCLVIASGPSAESTLQASAPHWHDWPAITVNDSWRLNLRASALYAADARWWSQRDSTGLRYVDLVSRCFRGTCWTSDPRCAKEHSLNLVDIERKEGLSTKEGLIRTGGTVGNSGAQAINLAYLWGARRLLLVGFDMRETDGRTHWHGDHPKGLNNHSPYSQFIAGMGAMAVDLHKLGVEVINCSPHSALPYWPQRDMTIALE